MQYQGFRSISDYEAECARLGHSTRRVPFHKGNEKYFALVSSPPGHPTGSSIESWTLFTADETQRVLDGIISGGPMNPVLYMRDGLDVNWLGKLAAHGFYPDDGDAAAPPPVYQIVEDDSDFPQFSLLLS